MREITQKELVEKVAELDRQLCDLRNVIMGMIIKDDLKKENLLCTVQNVMLK